MNLRRVAVMLTTFGAVAAAGMSSASAATVANTSRQINHHDWCYAQHWRAGDSHWRQCDDVSGWWNQNRYRHDDNNGYNHSTDRRR